MLSWRFGVYRKDVLILISNSIVTEIKPVIQYSNRFKITLIISPQRKKFLYKASDIKLLIEVKEAALSLVPTSSSTEILAWVIAQLLLL